MHQPVAHRDQSNRLWITFLHRPLRPDERFRTEAELPPELVAGRPDSAQGPWLTSCLRGACCTEPTASTREPGRVRDRLAARADLVSGRRPGLLRPTK